MLAGNGKIYAAPSSGASKVLEIDPITQPPTTTQAPTIGTKIDVEYDENISKSSNKNDIIINLDFKRF